MNRRILALAVAVPLVLGGCSGTGTQNPQALAHVALVGRIDSVEAAVQVWRDAETLLVAKAAAEGAFNFGVGPDGARHGDADGNGDIQNPHDAGLLHGLHGEPGIAQDATVNGCVETDVLGGSWDGPATL